MKNFKKGAFYSPRANFFSWQGISIARRERAEAGHGVLELVWIESHQTLKQAINARSDGMHWYANWYADQLVEQAAIRYIRCKVRPSMPLTL